MRANRSNIRADRTIPWAASESATAPIESPEGTRTHRAGPVSGGTHAAVPRTHIAPTTATGAVRQRLNPDMRRTVPGCPERYSDLANMSRVRRGMRIGVAGAGHCRYVGSDHVGAISPPAA